MKVFRKKLWSLLAALVLIPSLIAPAMAASPIGLPSVVAIPDTALSTVQGRFVDYDLNAATSISVIVELAGEPLAVYEENMRDQGLQVTAAAQSNYLSSINTGHDRALRAMAANGLSVSVAHRYAMTFNGMAITLPANQVAGLLDIPGVIDVFPDIEMQITGLEHSLPAIGAPQAWALPPGLSGEGILVAVLDTGADYMHPDLGGGIGPEFTVVGGWDFIDDDGDPMERKNDPGINPATGRDWNTSHGTHVAATVMAVAPEASLYIIRVLGRGGSGSSSDVMAGIERTVQIGADVANMSLGGALGHPDSPWARAVDNAVRAGVAFTVSAGNSGPGERTTGTYANTRLGIAVGWADTTIKPLVLPRGATLPMVGGMMTFSPPLAALTGVELEFVSVGLGNVPADFRNAQGISLVTGRIALMERGGQPFAVKSRNALDAGAVAAIIFNNAPGQFSGTLGSMRLDDIPTLSLSQADGHALRAMAAGSRFVTFSMASFDLMSPSSSRGPDALLGILPHVSAPGQDITAAYPFPGTDGSHVSGAFQKVPGAGNPWFGTISGTSMAAPHVAGAVALMLQASPTLTPEQIRLSLMNTATNINDTNGLPYRPIDQGAGMINVFRAVTASLRIDPGMLNFREVVVGETNATLALQSLRSTSAVFRTRVEKFNTAHAYEVLVPSQITVGANARVNVPVSLFVDASLPFSEPGASNYTGFIILENVANPAESYRVPFFFVNGQLVSQVTATPDAFSPNGDGVQDTTVIGFTIGRPVAAARIMVNGFVQGASSFHVAVASFGALQPGRYSFEWNGAIPAGFTRPDGFRQVHVQVQPTVGAAWAPATLSAGNTISSAFARLQIDTTPPDFYDLTPVIVPATPNQVRIRGAVDDLLISNVMSDGGSVWVNGVLTPITSQNIPGFPGWDWAGFESAPVAATLSGDTTVALRARDAAGNERNQQMTFAGLTLQNPATTTVPAATTTVRVQGTVAHGMTLTINGVPATYNSLGSFDVTLPLEPGPNTFTVVASVPAWGAAFAPITREFTVVRTINVDGLSLAPASSELHVGGTVQLTATITPATATQQAVTWTSSDTSVATVSNTGLVTAMALGTATITARTVDNNLVATASITVVPTPVASVTISPLTPSVSLGAQLQMSAQIVPADATNQAVTFASSNPAVATITPAGLLRPVALGTTTITVTTADGARTASTVVTIIPAVRVRSITLTPAAHTIQAGTSVQLTPTISPTNATNQSVTWVSTNPAAATIDGTGRVTAIAPGFTHVMVTTADGQRSAIVSVTVTPAPPVIVPVTGVTVAPTTATLNVNGTLQLTATVAPDTATNRAVTWSSSAPAIATVSNTGLVTALFPGVVDITVTTVDGSFTATARIDVQLAIGGGIWFVPVTGVTVSPTTATINAGASLQLAATIAPSDASDKTVTWSSSDNTIATVSPTGLVTGRTGGTATITVTTANGNFQASAVITVTPAVGVVRVRSITITPTAHTIVTGGTVTLAPEVLPVHATNRAVTWLSTNPAAATVSSNGVVTAVAPGFTHIIITTVDGSRSVVVGITVTPAVLP